MARKPLRSQLNQIRAWVRQGRTDAWIAHQLDVSASELREFVRRHDLSADGEETGELDLRDEIEAEIEAAAEAEAEEQARREAEEAEEARKRAEREEAEDEDDDDDDEAEGRRRRRRRGGRGRGRRAEAVTVEASFDHGETDGYGLWLDPSITDEAIYAQNWAGHRELEVQIEPDRIVIRRA